MRVLLSAYACRPNHGSESGVGWNWALEIARFGHEVHVITRESNRRAIESFAREGPLQNPLVFHYHELGSRLRIAKGHLWGEYLYYILWQWGAARKAETLNKRLQFDLVHHLTYASIRLPSFMWRLGLPFIFGPAGGGESAPKSLRRGFPLRGKIGDSIRDLSNALVAFDPLMRAMYANADQILVTTTANLPFIPKAQLSKVRQMRAIGISMSARDDLNELVRDPIRLLFVGRFLYWKGMHLGLDAFAAARRCVPDLRLTLAGKGPQERAWRRQAATLGISQQIDWVPWTPAEHMSALYGNHDILLFPSLHDSGGSVVLEAAAHGLPVICLDLGGPGSMVTEANGIKIPTSGSTEEQVIEGLAEAIVKLSHDHKLRLKLRSSSQCWAKTMSWSAAVAMVYAAENIPTYQQ